MSNPIIIDLGTITLSGDKVIKVRLEILDLDLEKAIFDEVKEVTETVVRVRGGIHFTEVVTTISRERRTEHKADACGLYKYINGACISYNVLRGQY